MSNFRQLRGLVALAAAALTLTGCATMQGVAESAAPAPAVGAASAIMDAMQEDLREARASSAGMSAERLAHLTAMSQSYVDEGKLAGVVTLVARDGKIVHFEAVGNRGADDDRPLTKDALFRIYSMTKPITAVAAMMLYEEGKFQLSDPVEKFVPELADLNVLVDGEEVPAENTMTMLHLLTHTGGLSYGFNPEDPLDQMYREKQPLGSRGPRRVRRAARRTAARLRAGRTLALQRRGGRDGSRRRALERPELRRLPQGAHLRTPGHGGHVLQRAGGKARPLPAEPLLERRGREADADGRGILRQLPQHHDVFGGRRPGLHHHGLPALLRDGAARRRTRRRAAAEPENRGVHDRQPPRRRHRRRR